FPRRLAVGQMYRPGDARLGRGNFLYELAGAVVAEQSETRRLPLDAALSVLVASLRSRMGTWFFRADEETGRTVAEARDPDGRMDFDGVNGFHRVRLPQFQHQPS